VILYLVDEEPELATAQGSASIHPGVEDVVFCFLRFPSGKIAHMHLSWLDPHKMRKMTVVGREKMVVFDDMEPERKVTVYDKTVGASGEAFSGDISIPKIATDEPLRLECSHFLALLDGNGDGEKVARDGAMVVRALEQLTESLSD
jgi:predicted dehydrogenase